MVNPSHGQQIDGSEAPKKAKRETTLLGPLGPSPFPFPPLRKMSEAEGEGLMEGKIKGQNPRRRRRKRLVEWSTYLDIGECCVAGSRK